MDESKELLRKFVNSKSQFFELKDGEEKTVKYLSAEPVTTHYQGKPVESIRFHLEYEKKEVYWDRTSRDFAKQMLNFSSGDILTIKIQGQKNQTKYFINKVNK